MVLVLLLSESPVLPHCAWDARVFLARDVFGPRTMRKNSDLRTVFSERGTILLAQSRFASAPWAAKKLPGPKFADRLLQ